MNGIDISHWQGGMDLTKIPADFAIMKATEGTYYADDTTETFFTAAQKSGKLCGLYHFASGENAKAEAEFFTEHVKDKLGKAILALDWEGGAVKKGVGYAKEWLDTVYALTGVRPFIYMSKNVVLGWNWAAVAPDYPLWVAQYAGYEAVNGYRETPWSDGRPCGAWGEPKIFQYTSSGFLPGWDGRLDLDKAYMTAEEWGERQKGPGDSSAEPRNDSKPVGGTDLVDAFAREVIAGRWGNEPERTKRIMGAIQGRVNELLR